MISLQFSVGEIKERTREGLSQFIRAGRTSSPNVRHKPVPGRGSQMEPLHDFRHVISDGARTQVPAWLLPLCKIDPAADQGQYFDLPRGQTCFQDARRWILRAAHWEAASSGLVRRANSFSSLAASPGEKEECPAGPGRGLRPVHRHPCS